MPLHSPLRHGTGLRWLWLSALVIALDQATKWLAAYALVLYQPVPLLPFFNLTLMYNTGAAFSLLAEAGGWQRWLFAVLAVGVSGLLIVWLYRLDKTQRWQGAALALVLGGALGNLVDRMRFGHVVDFLDVYYGPWHFPAFNVADSAITVGAVILLIDAFFGPAGEERGAEGGVKR